MVPLTGKSAQHVDHLAAWIQTFDRPLPEALLAKCKPLFCELCSVQVNSPQQARTHYDGKSHDKHTRHFLAAWAAENQCDPPKKQPGLSPQSGTKVAPVKPSFDKSSLTADDLYCAVCDLSFTSPQHASQHFSGRNHTRRANGLEPLKNGYFNTQTSKWQRHPTADFAEDILPTNLTLVANDRPRQAAAGADGGAPAPPKKFFCDLCKVGATSQKQLDMHLQGKSHRGKLQDTSTPCPAPIIIPSTHTTPSQGGVLPNTAPTQMTPAQSSAVLVSTKLTSNPEERDYSPFRTPGGQFYCSGCNITLNSQQQFLQHTQSKKHALKAATASRKRKAT